MKILYKKIIPSRRLRQRFLRLFDIVPDEMMLKLQYYIKFGRKLNLKKPERYTEKLQWYKLFYRNPLMPICVDKYKVRSYVVQKGLSNILNEIIGCYDNVEEIDFLQLPSKFVLKDTLGGGGNSVLICKDKSKFDWEIAKKQTKIWLDSYGGKHPGREWVYDNGENRLLVERYIESDQDAGGLIDYKFFCFSGRCEYIYGICDRQIGKKAKLGIYDRDFNLLPYWRLDEKPMDRNLSMPANFIEMRQYAELLAKDFPHVRVDLYNQDGKIIFGEMTFFDGSGYMNFEPDEFDFMMGDKFVVP